MKDTAHYDVRVIHLVRDPRPLLKSRSKPGFGSLDGTHKTKDYSEEVLTIEVENYRHRSFFVYPVLLLNPEGNYAMTPPSPLNDDGCEWWMAGYYVLTCLCFDSMMTQTLYSLTIS